MRLTQHTTLEATTSNDEHHRQAENLQRALTNSRTVGIAVGILMVRRHSTRAQAIELLQHASIRRNREVAELGAEVVEVGNLLDHGPWALNSSGEGRPT